MGAMICFPKPFPLALYCEVCVSESILWLQILVLLTNRKNMGEAFEIRCVWRFVRSLDFDLELIHRLGRLFLLASSGFGRRICVWSVWIV